MANKSVSYALAALFLLQPAMLFAAEKDGGSFFHRSRKAPAEKKAAEPAAAPAPVSDAGSSQETVFINGEAVTLERPPVIPDGPGDMHLIPKEIPTAPQDFPSMPPPIPGAPKGAPKAPSVPKTVK